MFRTLGEKIQELVDTKYGSMNTVKVDVSTEKGTRAGVQMTITTVWHGNDYTHSGYLQAHRNEKSFIRADVEPHRFWDGGHRQHINGTRVVVKHIIN